jgi:hypothetical protein
MEGRPTKTRRRRPQPRTKRELIIEVWNRLGRTSIGEVELGQIQQSTRGQFGEGADESPAAIARVLADEGAELRHPEVIEFDARWREAKIEREAGKLNDLDDFLAGKPLRLEQAESLIRRLETLRKTSETSGDQITLKQVRNLVINARRFAESLAKDRTLDATARAEQAELAEWLKVWIHTPNLFGDWLELRRRAPDFRRKFSE